MAQTEQRPREAVARPPVESNGSSPAEGLKQEREKRRLGFPRPPGIPILLAALVLVALLGYLYWHDQTIYVTSDNAVIRGVPVLVGSPGTGEIRSINVDIGDEVTRGEVVATAASLTSAAQISIRAPIDGIVVARLANPGDTATAARTDSSSGGGARPILTLVDPANLWVEAQIDEASISRIKPGQVADVTVNSLAQPLVGRVALVGRASTAAAAQLSQGGAGQGSGARAAQFVPVRIDVDYGNLPLVLGSTASIRIRVQD